MIYLLITHNTSAEAGYVGVLARVNNVRPLFNSQFSPLNSQFGIGCVIAAYAASQARTPTSPCFFS